MSDNISPDATKKPMGAPKKQHAKKLTVYKKVGFTESEYAKLLESYEASEYSSFTSFLRNIILKNR